MRRSPLRRAGIAAVVVAAIALVATGCGGGGSKGPSIALLLPETKTTRYETQDRPHFVDKVKALCPSCKLIYENANQNASTQQSQADSVLTQGAKVMVLDPVDAASATAIVTKAKAQGVKVVSYDRLIPNAAIDAYISFDNQKVGQLQATSLNQKLKSSGQGSGTIVMINGAPTDSNAAQFKAGALSVFKTSSLKIGKSYDTPDWSPDQAQTEMQQAITALGNNGFVGVYAANDGTAGGAIAAMKSAGIAPSSRPTTGQDAQLDGIQRILIGDQYMTVYKAVKPEAEDAAQIAVAFLHNQPIPAGLANKQINNGSASVPSVILTPVAVTKANVKSTVVADGFWTPAQICTSAYAAACKAAGIG